MGTKFRPFSSNGSAYNDGFYIGTSILGSTCDVVNDVKTQKSCSVLSYELPGQSESPSGSAIHALPSLLFSNQIFLADFSPARGDNQHSKWRKKSEKDQSSHNYS